MEESPSQHANAAAAHESHKHTTLFCDTNCLPLHGSVDLRTTPTNRHSRVQLERSATSTRTEEAPNLSQAPATRHDTTERRGQQDPDASYVIYNITHISSVISEWDDEDVDEILIIKPKTHRSLSPWQKDPLQHGSLGSESVAELEDRSADTRNQDEQCIASHQISESPRNTENVLDSVRQPQVVNPTDTVTRPLSPVERSSEASDCDTHCASANKEQEQELFWDRIDDEVNRKQQAPASICRSLGKSPLFSPKKQNPPSPRLRHSKSLSSSILPVSAHHFRETPLTVVAQDTGSDSAYRLRKKPPKITAQSIASHPNRGRNNPGKTILQPSPIALSNSTPVSLSTSALPSSFDSDPTAHTSVSCAPPPYSVTDEWQLGSGLRNTVRSLGFRSRSIPCLREVAAHPSTNNTTPSQARVRPREPLRFEPPFSSFGDPSDANTRVEYSATRLAAKSSSTSIFSTMKKVLGISQQASKPSSSTVITTPSTRCPDPVPRSRTRLLKKKTSMASLAHARDSAPRSGVRMPKKKLSMASLSRWSPKADVPAPPTQTEVFQDTAVTPFDLWYCNGEEGCGDEHVSLDEHTATLRLLTPEQRGEGRVSHSFPSLPGSRAVAAGLGLHF